MIRAWHDSFASPSPATRLAFEKAKADERKSTLEVESILGIVVILMTFVFFKTKPKA
jgi:hypothetical protein